MQDICMQVNLIFYSKNPGSERCIPDESFMKNIENLENKE